jgi:hypothetical protein
MEGASEKVLDTPTVVFDGSGRESTLLVQILLEIGHELGKALGAIFGDL